MENLLGAVELYNDFVVNYEEYRTPDFFVNCLADTVVSYWHMLLFVPADGTDADDAAKAEELLIHCITTEFTDAEKLSLQQAARRQLKQRFPEQEIDPEDEAHNREQRFLTFIATGRFEDMDLL